MPQIAQQDYIRVFAPEGREPKYDANVLATLAKAIENGIIFDVIFGQLADGEPDSQSKVLSYVKSDKTIFFVPNGAVGEIVLNYTPTQYQGLAAVQAEVDRLDGKVYGEFPILKADNNGLLSESGDGYPIGTPEGYQYKVTLADGKIATIEASTAKIEGDIAISIEDAQKLIGLPCSTD